MMGSANPSRVWCIIPAAGASRRMGRAKQILPVGNTTMVGSIVRTVLHAGVDGVVVVTRRILEDHLDLPQSDTVRVVFNEDANSDMLCSIRIGLKALLQSDCAVGVPSGVCNAEPNTADNPADVDNRTPEIIGVMVVPGDMPSINLLSYRQCLKAFSSDPTRVVLALYHGRRGHPIIFPLALRTTVESLQGGLRTLPEIASSRVTFVETDDPGTTRDVDTKEDYQAMKE